MEENILENLCDMVSQVDEMIPLGILVYGYGKTKARSIHQHLEAVLDTDILLISATDREEDTVESIITNDTAGMFKDETPKILLFLGFSDEYITRVLDAFSQIEGVERPIFCGLTEENSTWPFNQLLSHLEEEHRYWSSQK